MDIKDLIEQTGIASLLVTLPTAVLVSSDEFGNELYKYDALAGAIEGLNRLVVSGIAQQDGVERSYQILIGHEIEDHEDSWEDAND